MDSFSIFSCVNLFFKIMDLQAKKHLELVIKQQNQALVQDLAQDFGEIDPFMGTIMGAMIGNALSSAKEEVYNRLLPMSSELNATQGELRAWLDELFSEEFKKYNII